eukprot:scaffold2923_cov208-Prasinococcus_capsulatus_cf.AAC.2
MHAPRRAKGACACAFSRGAGRCCWAARAGPDAQLALLLGAARGAAGRDAAAAGAAGAAGGGAVRHHGRHPLRVGGPGAAHHPRRGRGRGRR